MRFSANRMTSWPWECMNVWDIFFNQTVVGQLWVSSCCQEVVGPLSGSPQAIVKQFSGSHQIAKSCQRHRILVQWGALFLQRYDRLVPCQHTETPLFHYAVWDWKPFQSCSTVHLIFPWRCLLELWFELERADASNLGTQKDSVNKKVERFKKTP